ncbi:Y-family DNA polymerase [Alkalimarinus sediminis]|uniref:DNA polymerase Y family protein n=1 Tax=Alkalimarinus sediminis TaxID=1632866 RepID=A0A9E8HMG1_9ALTE|nr:DNA polymerase Y family protein [Alkalimarinus sediminis]UZW75586.1 DNA polymerase Y family protein [Alkalimarinus sediminis]
MLWLYLDFPQLPLDHLMRGLESPQPLVVVDGTPPLVKSVNHEAHKSGVAEGMSLSTAYCLLPELNAATYDPIQATITLESLAASAYQYASHITLYPPDGLLLEVGSMLKLFNGLNELWNQLYAEFSNQGFTLYLATAATPIGARLLARNQQGLCSDNESHIATRIAGLTLHQAELPNGTAERCRRMGIKTLQQLISLPLAELTQRFGTELTIYLNKILGKAADPQTPYQRPHSFFRRLDFVTEMEHINGVLFPLQRLLQELSDYLTRYQLATDTLAITLLHREHSSTEIIIRSAQQEHHSEELMLLCRLRLERHTIPAPMLAITLKVDQLTPLDVTSDDFFTEVTHQQSDLRQLMSKLQARLGDHAITQLMVNPEHRPEKAQMLLPTRQLLPAHPLSKKFKKNVSGPGLNTSSSPTDTPAWIAKRPLWLCSTPYPITPHNLQFLTGPERISSGWWDQDAILRDYYTIQFPHGALGWGFRDAKGGWFLQGWFA